MCSGDEFPFAAHLGRGESASSRFTDRVVESEALRRSLVVHRAAVDADAIDGRRMNNVLVFYGFGGVGKSALSVKLEEWVNGGVGCEHWSAPPTGFRVVTARWDLRDTEALKSPVLFYLRLRRAVAEAGVRTPLLDVGIVAMATKFNAGRGDGPDELLAGVPRLAENLLRELFPGLDDPGVGLSPERHLLSLLTTPGQVAAVDCAELPVALAEIMAGEADVESLCVAVKALGWLFSQDLRRLDPGQRPLPVVFVDTFEVLEGVRDERVVNSALGTLHSCLLVVTGREMVNWAIPRISLPYSGPQVWPSLARTSRADEEPRQHLVGELSVRDAQRFLEAYLGELGLPLADGLCARLAQKARLPIHIDVIVELARRFAQTKPVEPLTIDAFEHDQSVRREDLIASSSPECAHLFQAAAVARQFDAPLLAAIAQVSVGVAQAFLSNSLIQKVRDKQHFQYHLHDEVWDILEKAGWEASLVWDARDRVAAAQRALQHLKSELIVAKRAEQMDLWFLVQSIGYRIAARYGLERDWEFSSYGRHLSRMRLSRLTGVAGWSGKQLMQDVYLCSGSFKPELHVGTLKGRRGLGESWQNLGVDRKARLCLAYAYRDLSRYSEALELLRGLGEETSEAVYVEQYIATCVMARRYREAVAAWLTWGEHAGWLAASLMLAFGLPDVAAPLLRRYLERSVFGDRSLGWISQLRVTLVDIKCWQGAGAEEDLRHAYLEIVPLEPLVSLRDYWKWQALWNLFDDARVAECWQQLKRLVNAEGEQQKEELDARFLVAGMRVLAVGDRGYLDELVGELEKLPEWVSVPVEFLYEHLGDLGLVDIGLQAPPTQWVGDREEIKRRWLSILHCVVAEARAKKDAR